MRTGGRAAGIALSAALAVGASLALTSRPLEQELVVSAGAAAGVPPIEASAGSSEVHHYEYVFPVGSMYVYDIDNGHQLVEQVSLPDTDGVRGVMVNPSTHVLYIAHGGDGPSSNGFDGSLLAYDLLSRQVLWNRPYPFPIDSGALTRDGSTIYMPSGENEPSGVWNILDATNGEPLGTVQGGAGAHNTIVGLNGRYVYLAGRDSTYVYVRNASDNQLVSRVGPLVNGARPFTVNGSDTLIYTTATDFLGFQVSAVATGQVLYTVPIPGLPLPEGFPLSAPSHGIALTPDERELYVYDAPYSYVHVFDVSRVPAVAPQLIANIPISYVGGEDSPCAYDCTRSGWLQPSIDGRYMYVGDAGDVIETATHRVVANLPALAQTRQMLEIDWANGVPVATSTRYGIGHVAQAPSWLLAALAEFPTGPAPAPPGGTSPGGAPASALSGPLAEPIPTLSAPVPAIRRLAVSPRAFSAVHGSRRRRGQTVAYISYLDTEPALTTLTILRIGCPRRSALRRRGAHRGCAPVALGSFAHGDRPGLNRIAFSGRLAGRALPAGRYRVKAVPALRGRHGRPALASFTIRS